MKGAIGNAFIMNLVITFIIIFFMLLIGSIAYSSAYKAHKFLFDSLVDYVEYFNSVSNQKNICFDDVDCNFSNGNSWSDRVNSYLGQTGYKLSTQADTCPSVIGVDSEGNTAKVYSKDNAYVLKRNTTVGNYDYCIYQKRYYELNELDDALTKRRYSYLLVSYMQLDLPVIGQFIKLPIVSESKVVINFH